MILGFRVYVGTLCMYLRADSVILLAFYITLIIMSGHLESTIIL